MLGGGFWAFSVVQILMIEQIGHAASCCGNSSEALQAKYLFLVNIVFYVVKILPKEPILLAAQPFLSARPHH